MMDVRLNLVTIIKVLDIPIESIYRHVRDISIDDIVIIKALRDYAAEIFGVCVAKNRDIDISPG